MAGSMARTRIKGGGLCGAYRGEGLPSSSALGHGGLRFPDGADGLVVEDSAVGVVEAFKLFAFDLLVDEFFDGFGEVEFVGGEDGEGFSGSFGAAGAADAVDVIFGVFRDAVVDDVGDAADVDTAGGDIGGDEDGVFAALESLECFHTVLLGDVGVHDGGVVAVAVAFEHGADAVRFAPRSGEDHDGVEVCLFEEVDEEFVALVHGDGVEGVADGGGDFLACDGDFDGVVQAPAGEAGDNFRHGGGEEERLAAFPGAEADDLADGGQKPHVEHAVHFVEDEGFDAAESHGGAVEMVDEASGGGDDDVGSVFQVFGLLSIADASVEESYLEPGELGVFAEGFRHLVGEFAGGFQNEDLWFARRFQLAEKGEGECGGFSGTGLGRADDVASFQDFGNGLFLDGGGVVVAAGFDGFEDGF